MFRRLRRQDRALTRETALEIVKNGKFGVLSLFGENGYPYGVPIHYVAEENLIYFHCSKAGGHKIDVVKANLKVCFTVVETEDGIKSRSVIIFGTVVEIPDKSQFVLEKLIEKFVTNAGWKQAQAGISSALANVMAFAINCEHIRGKWIDRPEGR